MNATRIVAAVTVLAVLSGCKDEKKSTGQSDTTDRVRQAVEENIRSGAGAAQNRMSFRGVQVYPQAMPQRVAVCGQVDPFADDPTIFVPFVTIVTVPATPETQYKFEQYIGTTTSEASHVYVAFVDYCYEKGGPIPGPSKSILPMPPLPDTIADPTSREKPAATGARTQPSPPASTPLGQPASGTVTMRQNGNLHSDPRGPTVRVVSQGTTMRVFAQMPGGWYQVGDTAPWGWVHESMIERH